MSKAITFTASAVFDQVGLCNLYNDSHNAVVEHIADHFADNEYSSIDSLVRDLELAQGRDLIYYSEQAAFLNVASNRADVEEVFADLLDSLGEPIEIREISDMLIHALDHACNSIASLIHHADLSIVINAVDYLDPNPEVIITDDPYETAAEVIRDRLDMELQHSTTTVSYNDLAELEETLMELVRIA